MKVITEERLAKVINSICDQNEDINGITELISALEEIDTLTVSKLRPMCDAPMDGSSIFCVLNGSVNLSEMYFRC